MNILLINHYAGSTAHGMEFRPYYMAREWVGMGHHVTIVAASHAHVRTRQPDAARAMEQEFIDGIDYLWIRTPSYSGNGVGRALNIFVFVANLFRFAREIISRRKPDVVIASSTYPLDAVPAHRIALLSGARLVVETHDLWPLSPMELGGMSPHHPFIRLMQWAETYGYRCCDRVVSMLPLAERHMRDRGLGQGKFRYVPNGVVADEWASPGTSLPDTHAALIRDLRQRSQFLVAYAGAHGTANGLELLIAAAELLRGTDAQFLLIGHGPEKGRLQVLASNLPNVHFLPAVPKQAIPQLLAEMDVLAITLVPSSLFRFGISPNKLMDYMMAAKPIIQAIDAGNDMVREAGCGISVPPGDAAAFAGAVRALMQASPATRDEMGRRGRDYVMRHHDHRVLAKQFIEAMAV